MVVLINSVFHLFTKVDIEKGNIIGLVNSQPNTIVNKNVNTRKHDGDELSRNDVTPTEVRSWIVVWKVETDVNLSPV